MKQIQRGVNTFAEHAGGGPIVKKHVSGALIEVCMKGRILRHCLTAAVNATGASIGTPSVRPTVSICGHTIRITAPMGMPGDMLHGFAEHLFREYARRRYRRPGRHTEACLDINEARELLSAAISLDLPRPTTAPGVLILPETRIGTDACFRTEFVVDAATFAEEARALGITPPRLVARLFSEAIATLYPHAEGAVVCRLLPPGHTERVSGLGTAPATYVVSTLGELRLGGFERYVTAARYVTVTPDHMALGSAAGMSVGLLTVGGRMTVGVVQAFPGVTYKQAFRAALEPFGLRYVSEMIALPVAQ